MSDEFLDWLYECPTNWFLEELNKDSVTYRFISDKEEKE